MRALVFSLLLPALVLYSSCKKDLLHWQEAQQISSGTTSRLNQVFFLNDTLAFICGGERFLVSEILSSKDGGEHWSLQSYPQAGKGLYGITAHGGTLFTCGFDGKLLRSTDGGQNWQFTQLYRYDPYKKMAFFSSHHGVIAGGVSFNMGYRLHVDAGGNILQWDSLDYELNDVATANAATGFISGYGVIERSRDSGRSWQILRIKGDNFTALDVHSDREVYTCGYQGSIYKTTDGGDSWQQLRNGNDLGKPAYRLLDILFTDASHGYAVGENGLVIHSDDGGEHWMEFDRFTDAHLRSIVQTPKGALLVCGDKGNIWKLRPKPLQ